MLRLALVLIVLCMAVSCSPNARPSANESAPRDPFVGFFAHPSSGAIELKTADGINYVGSAWGDFGPFPFHGTREGNLIRGTINVDGDEQPADVEHTAEGLFLVSEGERTGPALKRFKDWNAFTKWFQEQGGYGAEIEEDE